MSESLDMEREEDGSNGKQFNAQEAPHAIRASHLKGDIRVKRRKLWLKLVLERNRR